VYNELTSVTKVIWHFRNVSNRRSRGVGYIIALVRICGLWACERVVVDAAPGEEDGQEIHYSIIGMVSDERQMGPDANSQAEFYLPGKQWDEPILIVRTAGDH
jgi:hypothetical protein